jgi:hypothetical protein
VRYSTCLKSQKIQKAKLNRRQKKLPRKLPDDPIARGVAIMREATEGSKKKPTR